MSLGSEQREFSITLAQFIVWIYEQGYEVTLGDVYRDPRLHGNIGEKKGYGHSKSNHKKRLAADLNLFKDGKYLVNTSDHEPLGIKWETMHPNAVWGGRFNDGNHYSFKHNGTM